MARRTALTCSSPGSGPMMKPECESCRRESAAMIHHFSLVRSKFWPFSSYIPILYINYKTSCSFLSSDRVHFKQETSSSFNVLAASDLNTNTSSLLKVPIESDLTRKRLFSVENVFCLQHDFYLQSSDRTSTSHLFHVSACSAFSAPRTWFTSTTQVPDENWTAQFPS